MVSGSCRQSVTDAHFSDEGVASNRRKGSRDNKTLWNDDLRLAHAWLVDYRAKRMKENDRPWPIRPEERQLLVTESGTPLTKSALDSAWQRMIVAAIEAKTITEDQRFSLHGLKHRGITDTAGNIGDKQDAAGRKERKTTLRYTHDLPVVPPPQRKRP